MFDAVSAALVSVQRQESRTDESNPGGSHHLQVSGASCFSKSCDTTQKAPAAPLMARSRAGSYGNACRVWARAGHDASNAASKTRTPPLYTNATAKNETAPRGMREAVS